MPTIIDALVIELGLDPKGMSSGARQSVEALRKLETAADDTGRNVSDSGKTAAEFFTRMRTEALAFFAVLTGGKALSAFATDTTRANVEAGRLAVNLGTSVQTLTTWQKAVVATGGAASDVSSGFQSLVSQLQTVDGTRHLAYTFGLMGVSLKGANGQIRDFNQLIPDMAQAAQRLGPQRFQAVASMAGLPQGLINLLETGPDHVKNLFAALQKYAPTERDTKASEQLLEDWTRLTAQSEAFGRSILTDLSPEIHDLMEFVSRMIDSNQAWIRQDIDKYAKKIGDEFKKIDWKQVGNDIQAFVNYLRGINWSKVEHDISAIAHGIDTAVESTVGWTNAIEGLFALWVGSKFAGVLAAVRTLTGAVGIGSEGLGLLNPATIAAGAVGAGAYVYYDTKYGDRMTHFSQDEIDHRQALAYGTLKQAGLPDVAAYGVIGSLMGESGLDDQARGDKGTAHGIAQWHPDRIAAIKAATGIDVSSPSAGYQDQLNAVVWDLTKGNDPQSRLAYGRLLKAKTTAEANAIFTSLFERPKDPAGDIAKRQPFADQAGGNIHRYINLIQTGKIAENIQGIAPVTHVTVGDIHVHSDAADPKAVAREVKDHLSKVSSRARQGNSGLQ